MAEYRPSFSVPAAWIAIDMPDGTVEYYQLDEDGCLVLTNGLPIPHHIEKKRDYIRQQTTQYQLSSDEIAI